MEPSSPSWRSAVVGIAIGVAFFLAKPVVNWLCYGGRAVGPGELVLVIVVVCAAAGLFTVAQRWGLIAAYAFVAVAGAAFNTGYDALSMHWQWMGDPEAHGLLASAFEGAYATTLVLAVWLLVYVMPRAMREVYERDELRREIERMRVRAALEPHFVLNTLNTISGLVRDQPEMARDLIGDVGDLLRDVVELADRAQQPVSAEVRWLERYARVLEARHAGRLAVGWNIDPAAREVPMPVLLLQPLLENAIQHGALQRPDGGRVDVGIRVIERQLRCTVEDNGPGMPADVRSGARGLDLTRRRLTCDVPGATLTIASGGLGTRVEIALPVGSS